ncbi:MAG: iron ABC transporter permease, partial [Chloroflexi bacterium]|nr:iron ABC transporter permease [Chloroflexota bacterium]
MALELLKDEAIPQAARGYPSLLRSRLYAIVGLAALLIIAITLTTAIGSTDIPLSTLRDTFLSKIPLFNIQQTWANSVETIIFQIRLPRLILAGLVGAALAVAGATYQGLFRNPLADPYLIGVAQGAALGAIIGFLLPVTWQTASIPLLAFL